MFASASQDGSVTVWDHRSSSLVAHFLTPLVRRAAASRLAAPPLLPLLAPCVSSGPLLGPRHDKRPLYCVLASNESRCQAAGWRLSSPAHLASRLRAHQQACRNVKFSPAPLDLLAFAEHRSRCHLVDCRMWDRQQVGASCEGSCAVTLSPLTCLLHTAAADMCTVTLWLALSAMGCWVLPPCGHPASRRVSVAPVLFVTMQPHTRAAAWSAAACGCAQRGAGGCRADPAVLGHPLTHSTGTETCLPPYPLAWPQVLDVGGQDCEPDISGIAFSPSGRRLYVGTEGGLAGGHCLVAHADSACCLTVCTAAVWVVLLAPLGFDSH